MNEWMDGVDYYPCHCCLLMVCTLFSASISSCDRFTIMAYCWALLPNERPTFVQLHNCLSEFYGQITRYVQPFQCQDIILIEDQLQQQRNSDKSSSTKHYSTLIKTEKIFLLNSTTTGLQGSKDAINSSTISSPKTKGRLKEKRLHLLEIRFILCNDLYLLSVFLIFLQNVVILSLNVLMCSKETNLK